MKQCPTTAIIYVTHLDYYDKFMCLQSMTEVTGYVRLLQTKRVKQLQKRFSRRVRGI